jgi:hypothetical protein
METDAKQALLDSIAKYKKLQKAMQNLSEEQEAEREEAARRAAELHVLTPSPGPFGSRAPGGS